MRLIAIILFLLFPSVKSIMAQKATISLSEYLNLVREYNPLEGRIELELLKGKAERRFGRGSFDPYLSGEFARKEFDEKVYYNKLSGNLSIPTPLGITLNAGMEENSGLFLNPENNTSSSQLFHLGVEVEPLSGFIWNKRMTNLSIGNTRYQSSKWKSQEQENNLILSASQAYINWRTIQIVDTVANQNLELANQYLTNTKQSFNQGEKSAIDTLEAHIYLQDAKAKQFEVQAKLQKANQMLLLYVFNESKLDISAIQADFAFNSDIKPESFSSEYYPALQQKQIELKEYQVKRRYQMQEVLPKVKLKFNPLLYQTGDEQNLVVSENNYKAGISIQTSLFQSQKRAKYQLSNYKLEEKTIEVQFYQEKVSRKLDASIAEYQQLISQHTTMSSNVNAYQTLLEAEQIKFNLGESSVFLLNKRQEKFLGGLEKLAKLEAKILYLKEFLEIQYGNKFGNQN